MNTDLAKALAYDPISDAEKRMGKSYKEDDSVTWLGMALMQDQRKTTDALLFDQSD